MQKDNSKHKTTILVISLGFLILYLIFLFKAEKNLMWMLWLSAGVSLAGLISKHLAYVIHAFWFWIADKIGFVMSRFILGICFVIFLIPIAGLARLFRKDFMFLKKQDNSYYKIRNHNYLPSDLKNPW